MSRVYNETLASILQEHTPPIATIPNVIGLISASTDMTAIIFLSEYSKSGRTISAASFVPLNRPVPYNNTFPQHIQYNNLYFLFMFRSSHHEYNLMFLCLLFHQEPLSGYQSTVPSIFHSLLSYFQIKPPLLFRTRKSNISLGASPHTSTQFEERFANNPLSLPLSPY